jgi:hypothetical protein
MLPVMRGNSIVAGEHGRPYLVVKLKPGWRPLPEEGGCVSARGKRISLLEGLPQGVQIEAMIPALANAPVQTLTRDERQLARYLHVVFPRADELAAYSDVLRRSPCVEAVSLPPRVALP